MSQQCSSNCNGPPWKRDVRKLLYKAKNNLITLQIPPYTFKHMLSKQDFSINPPTYIHISEHLHIHEQLLPQNYQGMERTTIKCYHIHLIYCISNKHYVIVHNASFSWEYHLCCLPGIINNDNSN